MQKDNTFIPYRRFDTMQIAQEFIEKLNESGIIFELDEYPKETGTLFYNLSENGIQINLCQDDFDKANSITLQDNELNGINEDYYLYDFSDEELIEVLVKPYEWGEIDRTLAPKILIQRGYNLEDLDIEQKKEDYIQALAQPQKESLLLIIVGYGFAIVGGLLGLAIGWGLDNMKTSLPNGKQVYTYTEKCRKHGMRIFKLGVIMLTFYGLLFIISLLFMYLK